MADKLRFSVESPAAVDPAAGPDPLGIDDGEDEPFYFGWRWEEAADGSRKLRQVPLTYDDLLSPEVRAEQEAARAGQAEERAGQEAAARRAAEEELERLRARLGEGDPGGA